MPSGSDYVGDSGKVFRKEQYREMSNLTGAAEDKNAVH